MTSGPVFANADTIQSLQDAFRAQTATWFGPLQDIATWTLLTLATISWAWSAIQMVLRNADLQEFVTELVRLIMFTGFFLALIINADAWSSALIRGFMWAGNQAAGSSIAGDLYLNPAGILERGFILSSQIIGAAGRITYLAFAILALASLVIYSLIAAYALLVMAEMYVVTAAGVLLLGFGGSQWTSDYAKRYLTYCVSVGAKLYVMFLVVGLGEQFIYSWAIGQDKSEFAMVLSILGILIMLLVLVKMIPDMIQGVINGASIGNNTPTIRGMATAAAGAVAGAAVGAAGGTLAVREASKLAGAQLGNQSQSVGKSTGTSLGSSNELPSGTAPSTTSSSSPLPMPNPSSSLASSSPIAHAGQTLKNLAQSAGSTLGGKVMGDYGASHGSFGGSMAQKMRAERLSMSSNSSQSSAGSSAQHSPLTGSISPASNTGSTSEQSQKTGWVAQTGGFNNLSSDDQEKATFAHQEWQSENPQRHTLGLGEDVSYVQDRHKERNQGPASYSSPASQNGDHQ